MMDDDDDDHYPPYINDLMTFTYLGRCGGISNGLWRSSSGTLAAAPTNSIPRSCLRRVGEYVTYIIMTTSSWMIIINRMIIGGKGRGESVISFIHP